MISDFFVRYRKLVAKYPDLDLQHADIISCILKHLHDDCKKYLLLHGSLTTLEQLERGLVFYDEQLRVLNFHKEASNAKGFAAFGAEFSVDSQRKEISRVHCRKPFAASHGHRHHCVCIVCVRVCVCVCVCVCVGVCGCGNWLTLPVFCVGLCFV